MVSNYTNKHITFNKGEYIGHLEPTITEDKTIDDLETHSTHSITLQKMMAEQVHVDIFDPPCHKLKQSIQSKLDTLLKEYETQFTKDETSTGTIHQLLPNKFMHFLVWLATIESLLKTL